MRNLINKRCFYVFVCTGFGILMLILLLRSSKVPPEEEYDYFLNTFEIRLDQSKAPNETEMYASIGRELRALPFDFMRIHENENLRLNESCAPLPKLLELNYHNTYWQTHRRDPLNYHLFGAYYDNRTTVTAKPVVRLLGMINLIEAEYPTNFCQLWFEEHTHPVIVPVLSTSAIWYKAWGNGKTHYYPHLITCELPDAEAHLIPQAISLVAQECDRASNCLKVIYEPPPANETKRGFAVCTKALWFSHEDQSARLVEWLELMRTLGASKVVLYDLQVHPNMTKVFQHYEREGFVEAPHITLGRGEPNLPDFTHWIIKKDELNHRLNQLIGINDCFYRNMHQFDYIGVFDMDEVIMPLGEHKSWHDIARMTESLANENCTHYAGLCMRNVYFPKYPNHTSFSRHVPKYFYMMQHVERVEKHLDYGLATKCLHNTNFVLGLHNHFALHYGNVCRSADINVTVAQMQHYREPDIAETLNHPVIDANIWRFKDQLVKRSMRVFRQLGFFRKELGRGMRYKRK